jgi:ABC-type transporter Mla subunit MlaD
MPNPFEWLFPCKQCAQLLAELQLMRVELGHLATQLSTTEHTLMSALEDLQAAVARLAASTSAEIKAVSDKLASLGGSASDADVEAAVTQLNATADALDAEAASLAPPPTP